VRPFKHPKTRTLAEATALAAVDMDEFYKEKIVNVEKSGKNKKKWRFKTWFGYEPDNDPWDADKDHQAFDEFAAQSDDEELKAAVLKG
jgi:hypothetical protein